jgi:diguanylate cyclase (GGDEF)-like protein/PAS domain S-box-containing protein
VNSSTSADQSPRPGPDMAVVAEQVRLHYESPATVLVNLVTAPIAAALLWPIYPAWLLLGWVGLFFVVIAARLRLWRRFLRRQPAMQDAKRWARAYTLGAIATGCLWGGLASVVFVTDDPAYTVFVSFVLGGMTAGAALRGSAYLPAFYGFMVPAIAPMVAALLAQGRFLSGGMGVMLTAFAAVLVLMGRDTNRRTFENFRMRVEQTTRNDDLQRLNTALKKEAADREIVAAVLEESSAIFRAIGDHAQDPMIIADANNDVVYWNPAAERTFGYMADEITGRSVHELLAPKRYRGKAFDGYKRFAATGEGRVLGRTLQYNATRKDGTEFPIELSVSAMRLGGTWHALGIARDVSARELAEAALWERGVELKEAQRLAHVGSWAWQTDTDALEWSEELYRIFGRETGQPAPSLQEHAQFMAPESFARFNVAMEACRDTGAPYEIDLAFTRPDGSAAWILVRGEAQSAADGRMVRIRGTAQDITERKYAEAKTREEEEMFRILVEQGMSGIFIVAEDGTLAYLNPRFAAMIEYEVASEAIGRPILAFTAEADKPAVSETMAALFSGRQFSHEVAVTILRKRGGTVDTLAQVSLATFQGKRAIIVVVLDITERKRAVEKIARLHEQMTATVAVLRRHERHQTEIARLSDILQSCHLRTEAYPIIAIAGSSLFRGTNGALALVADQTQELEMMAQWGADPASLPRFSFDDCWGLRTGQRYEVGDPGSGALCRHFRSPPRGPYICLPLTVRGETIGLLHLDVAGDGVIDDELRQLMLTFGDVVKLSLSNLKLRETLSEQAMRDELTGLFNRHYLAETLPREIQRARRNKTPLSVAIMDIDHFKTFNDAQGHDAGDTVLRELGAFLQESLRSGDIACRYGGEELIIVLPDCDLRDAEMRLRQVCGEIRRKTFLFRGHALPSVTMSVGLAQLSDELASADALITGADWALYAAKRGGRDRVEMFSGDIQQARAMNA